MEQETIEKLIRECMNEAQKAIDSRNTPFGCILTDSKGEILARAHNTVASDLDSSAHAEINALRQLSKKLKSFNFPEIIVFANAESCPMCMACCIRAGIKRFYFGARPGLSTNPGISAKEMALKAKQKIKISSQLLDKECAEQITAGYAKLEA